MALTEKERIKKLMNLTQQEIEQLSPTERYKISQEIENYADKTNNNHSSGSTINGENHTLIYIITGILIVIGSIYAVLKWLFLFIFHNIIVIALIIGIVYLAIKYLK